MLPLSGWLGIAGAVAAALAGWTVRDWKADSDQLALERKADEIQELRSQEAFESALRLEGIIGEIRADRRTNTNTIREIYRDVEVPAECAVPDSAVELLDNSIERANRAATGEPINPLPDTEEGP